MIKISVIVPVYNTDKYLERCIDSILSQTFKDFELILVNDGSNDNSASICENYAQYETRIKVIHQSNQGQAAARNNAIKVAEGEWIHFVDSDDAIHPNMLEVLYNAATENNVDISMCGMVEAETIPETFFQSPNSIVTVNDVTEDYFEKLYVDSSYRYSVVCAKLVHKRIVNEIPFENGKVHEDLAVVCRWLYSAKKVADTNDKLYYYMPNLKGTTKSSFSRKRLDNLWAMRENLRFYKNANFIKMLNRVFIAYMNTAITYYRITKEQMQSSCLSKDVQKMMRATYKEFHNIVDINDNFEEYIRGIMYPKSTKLICTVKHILNYKH